MFRQGDNVRYETGPIEADKEHRIESVENPRPFLDGSMQYH